MKQTLMSEYVKKLDVISVQAEEIGNKKWEIDQRMHEIRNEMQGLPKSVPCVTCGVMRAPKPVKPTERKYNMLSDEIADLNDQYDGMDDDLNDLREEAEELLNELTEETVFEVSVDLC